MASSDPNVLLVKFPATGAAAAVLVLYSCIGVNPVCAIFIPYATVNSGKVFKKSYATCSAEFESVYSNEYDPYPIGFELASSSIFTYPISLIFLIDVILMSIVASLCSLVSKICTFGKLASV
jgi:hypothetical protein